jgi:hypothetical protein
MDKPSCSPIESTQNQNAISDSEPQPNNEIGWRRREFLSSVGGVAVVAPAIRGTAVFGVAGGVALTPQQVDADALGPLPPRERQLDSYEIRLRAAEDELARHPVRHETNGDEGRFPNAIGNFSKTLPHDDIGEVDLDAYQALVRALEAADFDQLETVPRGIGGFLANPLGGWCFTIEGPDVAAIKVNPPPSITSWTWSAEMAELYWEAVCRDVPLSAYDSHSLAVEARQDLATFRGYRGPRNGSDGSITANDLFRVDYPGVTKGPMVSQLLYGMWEQDGVTEIDPKIQTGVPFKDPGTQAINADSAFMTTFDEWLTVRNGGGIRGGGGFGIPRVDAGAKVYARTARDLGTIAGSDRINSVFYRAAFQLGFGAAVDTANPYANAFGGGRQFAFATFGVGHLFELLGKVHKSERHAWFQKWFVHRFLRPEEGGGLVHNTKVGNARYPIRGDILNSPVLDHIFAHNEAINQRLDPAVTDGSYLLPQMFRGGAPTHPSFPAGHAITAGACITILKAWFDEDTPIVDIGLDYPGGIEGPVQPTPDGMALEPYDDSADPLTLGGEFNKLCHNLSWGRDMSGVHWRADNVEGNAQGEEVAIRMLAEEMATYAEPFEGFALTRFNGQKGRVTPNGFEPE